MSEFKDWPLIARYLSGECSDTERVKVESLANSNPQVQQVMQLMQEVWRQPEPGVEPSDIKKLWTQLAEKAEIIEEPAVQRIKWKQILPFRLLKDLLLLQPNMQRMLRFAAVVVLTISLTWVVTRFTGLPGWFKDTAHVNTVVVEYGKRKTLNLSDGTVVTLDAGSRIDYPAKFKGDTREVFLNGEGFFEVAPNNQQPFIVHASQAVIKVLGTKFNVRAWESSRKVQVAVAEGKVSLKSEQAPERDEVLITKGLASTVSENGWVSQPQPIDLERQLGWMHNEIIFEDAPLREVLQQLERWYDLKFILADSAIAEEHVTVHITEKSVDDILELLAALTDLNYERQGKTIHLGKN